MKFNPLIALFFLQISFFTVAKAGEMTNKLPNQSFYIGVLGGYGSSTWQGLVPSEANQNSAVNISTPIDVEEGGGVWGGWVGYEFNPFFAIEANYFRYPDAKVVFDELSLFSFLHDDLTEFTTHTEALTIMGKVMMILPKTQWRLFSSAGIANVHREDLLVDHWRVSPSFGVGLNRHFGQHFLVELGGNYIAGYGESQLNPTESYFPFLYSVTLRLAFCI